jgi:phosphotransferase system IIA component
VYPVTAVTDGEVENLDSFRDTIISYIDLGLAIKPSSNNIVAPFDGVVTSIRYDKYAINVDSIYLRSEYGMEMLISIGIDLFDYQIIKHELKVTKGDKIKQGQLLAVFDFAAMRKEGVEDVVICTILNIEDFIDVVLTKQKYLSTTDTMMQVILYQYQSIYETEADYLDKIG